MGKQRTNLTAGEVIRQGDVLVVGDDDKVFRARAIVNPDRILGMAREPLEVGDKLDVDAEARLVAKAEP